MLVKYGILWLYVTILCVATGLQAQSTRSIYRCDSDAAPTYSDTACARGSTVVAEESEEQRRASAVANKRLRADNAAIDKRLYERARLDARERISARKAGAAVAVAAERAEMQRAKADGRRKGKPADSTLKVRRDKQAPPKRHKLVDNRVYRP